MGLVQTEKSKSIYVEIKQDDVERLFSFPIKLNTLIPLLFLKPKTLPIVFKPYFLHQLRFTSRAVKLLQKNIQQ